jgi:hypothetical protein
VEEIPLVEALEISRASNMLDSRIDWGAEGKCNRKPGETHSV